MSSPISQAERNINPARGIYALERKGLGLRKTKIEKTEILESRPATLMLSFNSTSLRSVMLAERNINPALGIHALERKGVGLRKDQIEITEILQSRPATLMLSFNSTALRSVLSGGIKPCIKGIQFILKMREQFQFQVTMCSDRGNTYLSVNLLFIRSHPTLSLGTSKNTSLTGDAKRAT